MKERIIKNIENFESVEILGSDEETIVADFKKHLQDEEKSVSTIKKYIRDVNAFLAFASDEPINRETVITFKNKLQSDGYAVRSINSMIASLNSFFLFMDRPDLKVKTIKVQRQLFCPEDKELSKAEYKRLCKAAERKHNERLDLILQTICGTGIRVSELKFMTVEAVQYGQAVVSLKGKTRSVFIVSELQTKLLQYAKDKGIQSGSIFVTRTGKPMDRTTVWREMKALCVEAKVNPSKVFPHNLRHLFARVFYKNDKDIAMLADILGHSSINTTRIYIISTGCEHRQRMENMRLIL